MSDIERELMKASAELAQAQGKLAQATGAIQAQFAIAVVLKSDEANDVRLRAVKALTRGARSYAAGLSAIVDQMAAELADINRGQKDG